MRARLAELDMTQAELVARSRLAPMTIRELLFNTAQRKRGGQTLTAISEALGWPPGYLQAIADGRAPEDELDDGDPVLKELGEMKAMMSVITARLDSIERQLADGDGRS
jgi:hypothetical protein